MSTTKQFNFQSSEDYFYFVRHGETINNRLSLVNGFFDSELTKKGIKQSIVLGQNLQNIRINRIITSDLKRTVNTALKIAEVINFNKNVEIFTELRERNWGIHENKPILTRPPIKSNPKDGESWDDFYLRIENKINSLSLDRQTLVVGHKGVLRVLMQMFKQKKLNKKLELNNCELLKILKK